LSAANASAERANWLDRVGIAVSALCVAHCLTSAIVVTALASFGGVLFSHTVHEVGLVIAILLGAVALGTGVMRHGYIAPFATGCFGLGMMAGALSVPHEFQNLELLATLVGVMTLALGHDLNGRARSRLQG
jgi:MerC mercury resistance protein